MILRGVPEAVLVEGALRTPEVERLLRALPLRVVPADAHGLSVGRPCVGLFLTARPPVDDCYAWYVGTSDCPTWMHPAPDGAVLVLSLLGTALAQEQAGAAFRAAGRGEPIPTATTIDAHPILDGISRAACPGESRPTAPFVWEPDSRDVLLHKAFEAIDLCCTPSGAIAAAPPRTHPDEPDYGFFWQRDAAAAAFALLGLVRHGPDDLRDRATVRLQAYVAFVSELGRRGSLSTSRFTLAGEVVGGYGDPQHDGPAATALLLLEVAAAAALPYLQHLHSVDEVGYDLWELVRGRSYHAGRLRQRALGSRSELGPRVHVRDPEPPWFAAISGLDISTIGCELLGARSLSADAGKALGRLEDAFANRWPVNAAWHRTGRLGHGLGRFPEDGNDGLGSTGGNPWPVATLWAAQWHLLRGESELGMGFLDFVLSHGAAGHEQIDGVTGEGRGAAGLAWSAAELITTLLLLPDEL
jgi:hypothetical protein